MKTSERLRQWMTENNIRQQDIIDRTGISSANISYYVSGKREPKADKIGLIAKAFNVDPAWLMGFDVEKEDEPTPAERAAKAPHIIKYVEKIAALTPEKQRQVYAFIDFLDDKEGEKDDD